MIIEKELIIIGSGPAGLRGAEEAQKAGIDYLILERGEVAQSWKDIRQDMLMLSPCLPQRDWTSISDDFPIWKMDVARPYCFAWQFYNYLTRYSDFYNLKINSDSQVKNIKKTNDEFEITTDQQKYKSKFLIIATGFFGNPFIPDIPGMRNNPYVMHSHQFNSLEDFRNKRIIIIGGGNSAAETAIILAGYAQVFLLARNELKFFSKTKNLCDIRGISESYLMELINMQIIRYNPKTEIKKVRNGQIYFDKKTLEVNKIICATGYNADLNALGGLQVPVDERTKFPRIKNHGECTSVKNLYFIGPLAYTRITNLLLHGFIKLIPGTISAIAKRRVKELA